MVLKMCEMLNGVDFYPEANYLLEMAREMIIKFVCFGKEKS